MDSNIVEPLKSYFGALLAEVVFILVLIMFAAYVGGIVFLFWKGHWIVATILVILSIPLETLIDY